MAPVFLREFIKLAAALFLAKKLEQSIKESDEEILFPPILIFGRAKTLEFSGGQETATFGSSKSEIRRPF